eukprot:TRINITY_DN12096_c0_g1_i1.p1 TRINITY_DN12096_c0_g1~~TRINITY_DN12096_c0_g1_i1.p1  ORF type:complete len:342 (-),score=56.95 TRINITY_DN12096_c0_g1_i1:33-1058(-)
MCIRDRYYDVQRDLATLLDSKGAEEDDAAQIRNEIIIQSGEGMLALWSALKSCIKKGDKVLAIASGIFGFGIAEMAEQIGAVVQKIEFEYNSVPHTKEEFDHIAQIAKEFKPKMITAVHCETPSGTLTPLKPLGHIAQNVGALFYVDFVASAFAAEISLQSMHIDLGLLGSQKVLSCVPNLAVVTVSQRAWDVIDDVKYIGYDALAPWKGAVAKNYFPYTFNWHAIASLSVAIQPIKKDLKACIARHEKCAVLTRKLVQEMGLKLYASANYSPTVTAVLVPEGTTWKELDTKLRARGVIFGGNYGKLAGKVFRIGHMGSQADETLLTSGLNQLAQIIQQEK